MLDICDHQPRLFSLPQSEQDEVRHAESVRQTVNRVNHAVKHRPFWKVVSSVSSTVRTTNSGYHYLDVDDVVMSVYHFGKLAGTLYLSSQSVTVDASLPEWLISAFEES